MIDAPLDHAETAIGAKVRRSRTQPRRKRGGRQPARWRPPVRAIEKAGLTVRIEYTVTDEARSFLEAERWGAIAPARARPGACLSRRVESATCSARNWARAKKVVSQARGGLWPLSIPPSPHREVPKEAAPPVGSGRPGEAAAGRTRPGQQRPVAGWREWKEGTCGPRPEPSAAGKDASLSTPGC